MVVHSKTNTKRECTNTSTRVVELRISKMHIKIYATTRTCTREVLKHIGRDMLVLAFDGSFVVLMGTDRVYDVYERYRQRHRSVYLIGVDAGHGVTNDFYRINENVVFESGQGMDSTLLSIVRAQLDKVVKGKELSCEGTGMVKRTGVHVVGDRLCDVWRDEPFKCGSVEKIEGGVNGKKVNVESGRQKKGRTIICADQKTAQVHRATDQKKCTSQQKCTDRKKQNECDFYGLLDLTRIHTKRSSTAKQHQKDSTAFTDLYKYIKSKLSRHVSTHRKCAPDECHTLIWKCKKYKFVFYGAKHEHECVVSMANGLAAHKGFIEVCISLDHMMSNTKGRFAFLYEHRDDAVLFTWGIPVKCSPIFMQVELHNFKSAPECYARDLSVNMIVYNECMHGHRLGGVRHMSVTRHVIFVLMSIKPRYIPVSQVSKYMTFYKYVCDTISKYGGMVLTEDMLFSYFLLPTISCAKHFAMDVYREFKHSFSSKMQIVMHTDDECAQTIDRFVTCDAKNSLAKIAKCETEGILFTEDILCICEDKDSLQDCFQIGRCNEINYYKLTMV